jgi:hypothetical protein
MAGILALIRTCGFKCFACGPGLSYPEPTSRPADQVAAQDPRDS